MKKLLLAILSIPCLLLGGCNKSSKVDPPVEHSIDVSINEVSITEGEQYTIPIEIIKQTIVVCRSNDEEIATVTRDGVITAIKEGETTISISGGQDHFIVFVTVLAEVAQDSLQIVMPKQSFTLEKNDEFVLPLVVKYGNKEIKDPNLSYEYENEGIVSISSLTVTALKEGTTKCVVTATYEELSVSEIFTITVY